ncbi:uncharacterized protein LOC125650862 [Ostrea edulis]|uniref:uncharacterized protein LOC125650862 n=1 Tax=Ostrea edulis TaxID=37623 RepID=UPI0024AFA562|nr:uncharacterized protein LOC125650862 [Ostrea edulis]
MEGASRNLWTDDAHLSHLIADNLLNAVGDPQNQRLRRHILDVLDRLDSVGNQIEIIRSGSCAEGFRIKGSDVDLMYVDKLTKVVSVTPENLGKYFAVVKMVNPPGIPPGYFKLIVLTPCTPLSHIRDATRKMCGEYYLSNEAFLQTFQQSSKGGVRHGPCVLETDDLGTDHDRAFCLEYKEWPKCADEWIIRRRAHGWPSQELVSRIKSNGCHLMAIGSKQLNENYTDCTMSDKSEWIQDPLQWRLSFSVAEKTLVYAFNDTQFLTYGIFKLLNQEVFSRDPILKSGLCSYFLKTALYWTIEETPSDYWTPEHLVFCVDICFQRLISWVETGFCPNYFIRENNMFLGKVQEWQLAYISSRLSEIHNEGWRCLLKCHSLSHLKKTLERARQEITPHSFPISKPEEDYKILVSSYSKPVSRTRKEDILDCGLFSEILARKPKMPSLDILELELKNSLTLEIKENMDSSDMDIIRLRRYHNLSQLALIYLNISLTKCTTRDRYKYIRKAFCYLNHTRFADISKGNLTLATAHYCLGRFSAALSYIKEYDERLEAGLGYIYCSSRHGVQTFGNYEENMCGQGFSSMEKASLAVSYDFEIFRMMPLVPIEIALEVVMMKHTESRVVIPPKMYSVFLKILCYSNMSNLKVVEELSLTLRDCLAFSNRINRHLNYIMLAVTATKLGKYEDALRYYCLAHNCKRIHIMKNSGCPEWYSRTSCLFYIAQLLRMLV